MATSDKKKTTKATSPAKKPAKKKAAKKPAAKATASKKKPTAKKPKYLSQDEKRSMIAMRAYFKWEDAGFPHGEDYKHWIEAEQEVAAMMTQ